MPINDYKIEDKDGAKYNLQRIFDELLDEDEGMTKDYENETPVRSVAHPSPAVMRRREAAAKRQQMREAEPQRVEQVTQPNSVLPESIEKPELKYIGPEDGEPKAEAKPEVPAGPAKIMNWVELGPDGGASDAKPVEVSGGVKNFDQDLPIKPKKANEHLAAQAVGERIHPEENAAIVRSAFDQSPPQPPVVSASEIRPEIVSKEQLNGSTVLEPSDEPVRESSEEVISELDGLMEKDGEHEVEKPPEIITKPAIVETSPTQKAADAHEIPVKVVAQGPTPGVAPKVAEERVFHNQAREDALDFIHGRKQTSATEANPAAPKPVKDVYTEQVEEAREATKIVNSKIQIERVVAPEDERKTAGGTTVAPTPAEKDEGIIGAIKPADTAQPEIIKPTAIPATVSEKEIEPKHSIFRRMFSGLRMNREPSALDASRVHAQLIASRKNIGEEAETEKAA